MYIGLSGVAQQPNIDYMCFYPNESEQGVQDIYAT